MKQFNVSYIEVLQDGKTISSCYYQHTGDISYGSISNEDSSVANVVGTPDMFHKLIGDLVLPNIVHVDGNKVTKMSIQLIDGYDCYYTTSARNDDNYKVFVCFTRIDVPKILPIRLLSDLKQLTEGENRLEFDTDEELSLKCGEIIDAFRHDLITFRNNNMDPSVSQSTDQDLDDIIQIMNDNIDKFLQRQERISLLVDKTSQLNDNSNTFKRKTVKLKNKMWWHRMKNITLVGFSIILCIAIVFIFFFDLN
ncbi:hypothetical protein Kpol_543p47 [Vanderwaltozyma polyspora DSM 70294]|uniref:V-SNARE coiled-coil homology domain-containing protein n=1 Tax=Vanderwaltozyma polyspora (strain ATCC 22028 / DSM 70294 / BCRC 21397 / CBS 2163 / NBRC 10782 / NRRL Y-8283 / UCD 57-17) TaxID=436907 RepID=A7THQ1_VANPO|nr:uncharacterized protein Kpol_543p47 [Vanderwaltozyma polyspora DSM 70294]EDO18217.1 hypothetical protein Kpol_543p47 [Vanderwaltozyma polyspora DSM 70294]